MRKAALRQLERMAALPAAQSEDTIVALQSDAADQEVDLVAGVAVIFDNIAIGFEIEGIEQRAPPIRGQMPLEVRDRPQRAGADAPVLLRVFRARAGAGRLRLAGRPRTI